MAAGRHHSAWAGGWDQAATAKIKSIELHPQAKQAISDSWRSIHRFLPQSLALAQANLSTVSVLATVNRSARSVSTPTSKIP